MTWFIKFFDDAWPVILFPHVFYLTIQRIFKKKKNLSYNHLNAKMSAVPKSYWQFVL